MTNLRRDINRLESERRGETRGKGKRKIKKLNAKCSVRKKGINLVIEELKQRLTAKIFKRYEQKIIQFRQNQLFQVNQKQVYKELNGEKNGDRIITNSEDSIKFWSGIWSIRKEHNLHSEWLKDFRKQYENVNSMEKGGISPEMVKMQCRKMPNWKAPGKNGVQGYWLKNLITSMHPRIAVQQNRILDGERSSPDWITFGKTVMCQKDPAKGSAADNYRPISCLLLMWNIMTGILAKKMYGHLERENVLTSEQKGCLKGSRETKGQLLIDKTVLRDCKRGYTNLAMAWIDYKKVSHSWMSECLEMFGIANNVQNFLNNSMRSWKLALNASGENLREVDIRGGIFEGDSLSPLLSVLCMVPLAWLLRRDNAGYKWGNKGFKLHHLLFMDDLKLFAKSKNQIDSLVPWNYNRKDYSVIGTNIVPCWYRLCIDSVRTLVCNLENRSVEYLS